MVIDVEFANDMLSVIRDRLVDNEVDLNSDDWDSAICHINNYLSSWLTRRAQDHVIKRHYDTARRALRAPDNAKEIGAWQRDLVDYVFPVMNAVYGR